MFDEVRSIYANADRFQRDMDRLIADVDTDPDLAAIETALRASIARARARLTPVQRAAADLIGDTAGHYLLHGELPAKLTPEIRAQLETAMAREGTR